MTTISNIQLITLFPLLILMFTIIIITLTIALKRVYSLIVILSVLGMIGSFFSLIIINNFVPINISELFCFDKITIFYAEIIIFASLCTFIFSYLWIVQLTSNKEEFYLLLLISTLGALVLIFSSHIMTFIIGLELLSLPLIALINFSSGIIQSLQAALKYAVLSALSFSFMIFGIALIYSISGNLSFSKIGSCFGLFLLNRNLILSCGFVMLLAAFSFKLSIVPFHLWISDIYKDCPASVLIFISTVVKIAVFSVLVRFCANVPLIVNSNFYHIIEVMSFFSMITGSFMAMFQNSIKRMMGYSAISHLGLLLVIFLGFDNYKFSLSAVNIYIIGHLLVNLGVFGTISLISSLYKIHDVDSLNLYRGFLKNFPVLSVAMIINMFSLAGIPMTIGFLGKFYFMMFSIKEELWLLCLSIVISSIFSIFYCMRVISNLCSNTQDAFLVNNSINQCNIVNKIYELFILFISSVVLIIGFYPQSLIFFIENIIS